MSDNDWSSDEEDDTAEISPEIQEELKENKQLNTIWDFKEYIQRVEDIRFQHDEAKKKLKITTNDSRRKFKQHKQSISLKIHQQQNHPHQHLNNQAHGVIFMTRKLILALQQNQQQVS